MPGTTMGTAMNPPTEIAWRGQIEIKKTNGKYSLSQCVAFGDASPDIDQRVQNNLRNFVDQLNRDNTDLDNPQAKHKQ